MASPVDVDSWCAIQNVIHEHIWRMDHGEIMGAFELYAKSPRLEFLPPAPRAGAYEGREAVHGWFVERMKNSGVKCRHVISNIRMRPHGDGGIAVSHILTLFRDGISGQRETDPVFVADADEIFVLEGDGWRIAERVVTPVFSPG